MYLAGPHGHYFADLIDNDKHNQCINLILNTFNHHTFFSHHGHICAAFASLCSYLCNYFDPHGHIYATFSILMDIFIPFSILMIIFVCTGLAENGLENLPCPSSLLLGVLVTLLPKVIIVIIFIALFSPKNLSMSCP